MNDKLFHIIFVLILLTIYSVGIFFLINPPQQKIFENSINQEKETGKQTFTIVQPSEKETAVIILVGDIMLDRGVEYMVETQGNKDFTFPFLKIAEYLQKADILFGNLECPISDKGTNVGSIYSFRANPQAINGLCFAGFDVLSLANNHTLDYTRYALEDTFSRLNQAGIGYVGAGFNEEQAYSPIIKEINGSTNSLQVKVAFFAYTNLGPETWKAEGENSGMAWINQEYIEKIKKDIGKAKEKADILIVSLHAGVEYSIEPTQFQTFFAKAVIDAGADIVVGHHPHIVQKNEKYKNGWIFYSLGNFVFDQSFSEQTMNGQIVEVLIEDNKIKEIIPKQIELNEYFQPKVK